MRTVIVHILSPEQEKVDNAFDVVREALTKEGIDVLLFESATLREAAEVLTDQANKREPKAPAVTRPPPTSAFGHTYDEMGY